MSDINLTLEKCLTEIEARFVNNIPEEEFLQADRLFFQIEQGWWFYEDFFADNYGHLPHFKKLVHFAERMFDHCPILRPLKDRFGEMFTEFGNYRNSIPVYGCIMLNPSMTKVVLVCSWNGNSWGFPRGKINQGEFPLDCAIRETFEETGFNAAGHCKEDDYLVVIEKGGKVAQLFIATNVKEDTEFIPHTRKEVSKIEFHEIECIPKSFGVLPFIPKLRRWIQSNRRNSKRSSSRGQANDSQITPSRRDRRASPLVASGKGREASLTAQFNSRNSDTFTEDISAGTTRWNVEDMFAANAKLTGRRFEYSGNPHEFGSSHPRFIDYRQAQSEQNVSKLQSLDSTPIVSNSNQDFESSNLADITKSLFSLFPTPVVFDVAEIMAAIDDSITATT